MGMAMGELSVLSPLQMSRNPNQVSDVFVCFKTFTVDWTMDIANAMLATSFARSQLMQLEPEGGSMGIFSIKWEWHTCVVQVKTELPVLGHCCVCYRESAPGSEKRPSHVFS